MRFYCGSHVLSHFVHLPRGFLSVNVLRASNHGRGRVSDFTANDWILDSGAFSELSRFGTYRHSVSQYAAEVNRWSACGNMDLAVSQDWMCEPWMVQKTGLSVRQHQELTIQRYDDLMRSEISRVTILPVLQGYTAGEYVTHLAMYGYRLAYNARVGVGSVCKRNRKPDEIIRVLDAIKRERPDLRLHGFGLKLTALQNAYVCELLYSADSMSWSYHARRNGLDRNGLNEAMSFYRRIEAEHGTKPAQLAFWDGACSH